MESLGSNVKRATTVSMRTCVFSGCCRFLDANYRRPLILAELLGFHADVMCLQVTTSHISIPIYMPCTLF